MILLILLMMSLGCDSKGDSYVDAIIMQVLCMK